MAKINLARELQSRGHKLKDARKMLEDIAAIAERAALDGDEFVLPCVVTIRNSERKARIYHNPLTREKFLKGPHRVIVASLASKLKKLNIN